MKKPQSARKEIELATIGCFAPNKMVLDLVDILTWLCASLRTSQFEGPSTSYALVRKYSSSWHLQLSITLADLEPKPPNPGTCWYPLMRRSVIATGFPISARDGEKGIEMSLEVMITLSRVFTTKVLDGKYYFVGLSTALVPTQRFGSESLQWHFVQSSSERLFFSELPRRSVLTTIEFEEAVTTPDMLIFQLSRRRHFLGWCEGSQITIGTEIGTYTPFFTDVPEPSDKLQIQNLGANIGTSGMGIFGAALTANFTISSNRVSRDQIGSLRFESILRSAQNLPYILFDVDTKRAWLVPAICVILHMVHLRTQKEYNTSKAPYAQPDWNGGKAAFDTMIEHRKINLGVEDNEDPYTLERMVQEIWLGLASCPQKPSTKHFFKDVLYAYELMDIVTIRRDIRLKKIEVDDTGGWINLTQTVPLVLLCRGIGEAVSLYPIGARTCWSSVPTGSYLLCATIECLKALSDDIGGVPHILMQGREWNCPGSLFEECVCTDGRVCSRLQQLVRTGQARIPSRPFSPSGAVIFGKCLRSYPPLSSYSKAIRSHGFDNHKPFSSAEETQIHTGCYNRQDEPVDNLFLPRMLSQTSSRQNPSIYSLGENPPLVHDQFRNKSQRKNTAYYRNFVTLKRETNK